MSSEEKRKTIVCVPVGWNIYEVDGDLKSLDSKGNSAIPTHVAMEAIVLAGRAKRLATIQSVGDGSMVEGELMGDGDGDEHPGAGGDGPWFDLEA